MARPRPGVTAPRSGPFAARPPPTPEQLAYEREEQRELERRARNNQRVLAWVQELPAPAPGPYEPPLIESEDDSMSWYTEEDDDEYQEVAELPAATMGPHQPWLVEGQDIDSSEEEEL